MVFDNVFDEKLGGLVGGGVHRGWYEMYHFGCSVCENENRIV